MSDDREKIKAVIQRLMQSAVAFNDLATQLATLSRTMLYNMTEFERLMEEDDG